jgi:hypothetical protein
VCGCPYYIYVNFGRRGAGSIEECVNNKHNDHIPIARRARVRATARQKVVLDTCVRDGMMPTGIMKRLEAEGLDQGLTLKYVQRYKTNHKTAALGQAGFVQSWASVCLTPTSASVTNDSYLRSSVSARLP